MTYSYSTFTKKQANVLYAAIKRGELVMAKRDINRMYNLVGAQCMDTEDAIFREHCERAIGHLIEHRVELAQAELDGHIVRYEAVAEEKYMRPATIWDFDVEPGTMVEDTRDICDWVIY